jgi:hypothetical protein
MRFFSLSNILHRKMEYIRYKKEDNKEEEEGKKKN